MIETWHTLDTELGPVRLWASVAQTIRVEALEGFKYRQPIRFDLLFVVTPAGEVELNYRSFRHAETHMAITTTSTASKVVDVVTATVAAWLEANPDAPAQMFEARRMRAVTKLRGDLHKIEAARSAILREIGYVENGLPFTEYPVDMSGIAPRSDEEVERR
jgi:hypothetical protein